MGKRCLVAVCHNGPVVFRGTCQSLMEMGWGNRVQTAKDAHGFDVVDHLWLTRAPRVDTLRDLAAEAALSGPDDVPYTHLLFLDADMIWPSNVLERMLRHHDAGIVAGLYFLKAPPYRPVALVDGHQEGELTIYRHETQYGEDLVPVEAVGMGCTLIPVDTFRRIGPRPWFHYEENAEGWPLVSEDVPFCRRARTAGVPVFLDPTVKCGHLDSYTYDERHFRRYQQSEAHTEDMVTVRGSVA